GTGEPPPVPPRQYWNAILRTEHGKQRANQWFEGYRHGARVARDGDFREMGIVHSSASGVPSNAGEWVAGREMPPFGRYESAVTPNSINTLPDPATSPHEDQSDKPPAPKGLDARPNDSAPPTAQPSKIVPPASGAAPEKPTSAAP